MRLYTADALLTGASAEVVRRGGVLIDGSRISRPALRSDPVLGPGAEVVELGAVTLLPGRSTPTSIWASMAALTRWPGCRPRPTLSSSS